MEFFFVGYWLEIEQAQQSHPYGATTTKKAQNLWKIPVSK